MAVSTRDLTSADIPQRVLDALFTRYIDVRDIEECWPYKMKRSPRGYGRVGWRTNGERHVELLHRAVWVAMCGRIPAGMSIDHMCHNRACQNPQHLRLLSPVENSRDNGRWQLRKTHCPQGHLYDEVNTMVVRCGARVCRICNREGANRRYRQKVAAARGAM